MSRQVKKTGGYTLLELLVAVSIFSIISAMSYSGLRTVIEHKNRLEKVGETYKYLEKAFILIEQDLMQMANAPIRDELGDDVRSFFYSDQKSSFYFEFTRDGLIDWNDMKLVRQQRIAYLLDDDKLIRRSWKILHRGLKSEPTDAVLLNKVNSIELQWFFEQWSDATKLNEEKRLPRAIKLQIDFAGLGSIERIFAVTL